MIITRPEDPLKEQFPCTLIDTRFPHIECHKSLLHFHLVNPLCILMFSQAILCAFTLKEET